MKLSPESGRKDVASGVVRRLLVGFVASLPFGRTAAAADGGSAAERLAAVHARVFDPNATFSVRAVLSELDDIEAVTTPGSRERGQILRLRSFVEEKGGRREDSIRHGEDALGIEATHPFLSLEDKVSLHYGIARQAEAAGRCAVAIPHYRAALPLMAENGTSPNGQLGTRQRLAFCLHEAGQFAEARRVNEALLADSRALLAPDDPRTFPARTNLAQNEYSLGDTAGARTTLESLLSDAERAQDAETIDTALFQLGVLAFEGGRASEALDFMDRRLALARASRDAARLAAAQRDLQTLHDKLSGIGGQ